MQNIKAVTQTPKEFHLTIFYRIAHIEDMLGVGNNRVADHKTFVVESSDGFELSEDNKFVETNGTHETNTEPSNKDGTLEEAEAVQEATDERRDREVRNIDYTILT